MKLMSTLTAAAMLLAATSFVSAAETESGLKAGEHIGPFYVTKVCGAEEDGVKTGKNLCYRCKNGGRPQVMVFTHSTDEKVVKLVKELDAAIPKHEDAQLRAFVNTLGEDQSSAKAHAESLAASSKAKNVPFVLPNEYENGPTNYGLNPQAEVTVIMASGGKVIVNHAYKKASEVNVDAVISDLNKIVN